MALDMKELQALLEEEKRQLQEIVEEKGVKHYQNHLLLACGAVFMLYFILLKPTQERLRQVELRIVAEREKAQHAENFGMVAGVVRSSYLHLPKPEDREDWLFNTALDSARKAGLTLQSISGQTEESAGAYWLITVPVKCSAEFKEIGAWLKGLEEHKPRIMVTRIELERDAPTQGELAGLLPPKPILSASVLLAAVIPKSPPRF